MSGANDISQARWQMSPKEKISWFQLFDDNSQDKLVDKIKKYIYRTQMYIYSLLKIEL